MNTVKTIARIILVLLVSLLLACGAWGATPAKALAAATWYVTTGGNDSPNSCSDIGAPCLTINAALGKASAGDTIEVAAGTYTSAGTEVVLIDKAVTLSGGWDAGFTTQSGFSTIDGQAARRGITTSTSPVIVDHFQIQHGMANGALGGGIYTSGALTLNNSIVSGNVGTWGGGGIYVHSGTLAVNNSTISANRSNASTLGSGGGVEVYDGDVVLNNSTVSNNTVINGGLDDASGIKNDSGSVTLNNSTVSGNTGTQGIYSSGDNLALNSSTVSGNAGGVINEFGHIVLRNSIIAGNSISGWLDCHNYYGTITSAGYNLIGDGSCELANTGDQIGAYDNPIDPVLGPLQDNGGPTFTQALLGGSPALDAGNPATPGSGGSACPATDQRGVARAAGPCDIGAYEVAGPMVASIKRVSPSPLNAASVDFSVTFTEPVTGVDATDFTLTVTGLTGASVANVSGSGAAYTVTIDTGSANGTIRLDLVDDDSIIDAASNPLGGVGAGNGDATSGQTYLIDSTPPTVASIVRVESELTNYYRVDYTVTFSEPVTGVDATDFTLAAAGPSGASITNISSSDDATTYTVTVDAGSGDGTLRLDLLDDDSIMDAASNPLGGPGAANGNFNTGESYTIDKTQPTVLSIVRADPNPSSAASVNFTVTFSEAVTGVDASDFMRVTTGVARTSIANVSGSGAVYTVTVNTGIGSGTLRIDVIDNNAILDLATNSLPDGGFTDGETYTIQKSQNSGPLDTTFGVNGFVTTDAGSEAWIKSIAVQPDGKIVAIGSAYITGSPVYLLERYNADGSPDKTFGWAGGFLTGPGGYGDAIAIQPDGKILASGASDDGVALVRYKPNGAPDTSFGVNGTVITQNGGFNTAIIVQPNGQILLSGDYKDDFVVARYNSNGSPDKSFGVNGKALTDFGGAVDRSSAMLLQPDGKIILAGASNNMGFALARYNANGSPDTSFGNGGKLITNISKNSIADDLALQPDGKIVAAGENDVTGLVVLARYNPNGSLDKTFGVAGILNTKISADMDGNSLALQPDGRLMVSGDNYAGSAPDAFVLARYKSNGALDTTFGANGVAITYIGDASWAGDTAFQPDGKLIVAGGSSTSGYHYLALARYNVDYQVMTSAASQDGWVLESSENSNVGGAINSAAVTFNLGDDAANKQYRGILSFNTGAALPDNAVITSVTLKVKKSVPIDPVSMFQGFMADVKNGFFGAAALQASDFQAAANTTCGPFVLAPLNGWYSINLTGAKAFVNKLSTNAGLTQIRLRFKLDDNNNTTANILGFYSGNAPAADRPQLVVTYYVP